MSARPIPPVSELSAPYWDAARESVFVLQQCAGCGHRPFPPRAHCPECGGGQLDWKSTSGRGRVHTFTIVHRPPHPVFAGQCPFVLAVVELEEGVRMITNIVGCSPEEVRVGMPVQVTFESIDDSDVVLPVFCPLSV